MLIASENKIEMFSFHSDEFDDEHEDEQEKEGRTTGSVLFHLHQKVSKILMSHYGEGRGAF